MVAILIIAIGVGTLYFIFYAGSGNTTTNANTHSKTFSSSATQRSTSILTTDSKSAPTATPKLTSTPTPTPISTQTPTSTQTPGSTTENYSEFLFYFSEQLSRTSTPLKIAGIKIFESNNTMWVVYKGSKIGGSEPGPDGLTTREIEWLELRVSYALAIKKYDINNGSGYIPHEMRVVELNTSEDPEATFNISAGKARLFAYNVTDLEKYYSDQVFDVNVSTARHQRIAQEINKQDRNVTFYPNGTWEYTEPPKSEQSDEDTTSDESASMAGSRSGPVARAVS